MRIEISQSGVNQGGVNQGGANQIEMRELR